MHNPATLIVALVCALAALFHAITGNKPALAWASLCAFLLGWGPQ